MQVSAGILTTIRTNFFTHNNIQMTLWYLFICLLLALGSDDAQCYEKKRKRKKSEMIDQQM